MNNFKIIGISTQTTNENGQSIQDVEALWNRFWNENIVAQVPNKVNEDIYAVYTDYESDYMIAPLTIAALVVFNTGSSAKTPVDNVIDPLAFK